jgi:hypothetical protein
MAYAVRFAAPRVLIILDRVMPFNRQQTSFIVANSPSFYEIVERCRLVFSVGRLADRDSLRTSGIRTQNSVRATWYAHMQGPAMR